MKYLLSTFSISALLILGSYGADTKDDNSFTPGAPHSTRAVSQAVPFREIFATVNSQPEGASADAASAAHPAGPVPLSEAMASGTAPAVRSSSPTSEIANSHTEEVSASTVTAQPAGSEPSPGSDQGNTAERVTQAVLEKLAYEPDMAESVRTVVQIALEKLKEGPTDEEMETFVGATVSKALEKLGYSEKQQNPIARSWVTTVIRETLKEDRTKEILVKARYEREELERKREEARHDLQEARRKREEIQRSLEEAQAAETAAAAAASRTTAARLRREFELTDHERRLIQEETDFILQEKAQKAQAEEAERRARGNAFLGAAGDSSNDGERFAQQTLRAMGLSLDTQEQLRTGATQVRKKATEGWRNLWK